MTKPKIVQFDSPAAMLTEVQERLERKEAENSLMLGLLMSAASNTSSSSTIAFMSAVEAEGSWSLAAMMSPNKPLIVCSADRVLADHVAHLVSFLINEDIQVPGVVASVELAQLLSDEWVKQSGGDARIRVHQRLHSLHNIEYSGAAQGQLRLANASENHLVASCLSAFAVEALGESPSEQFLELANRRIAEQQILLWDDSGPCSMVAWSRPTKNTVTVNAVYTPVQYRSSGYATSAVAELSQRLLAKGYGQCVLYTDLQNPISNRIYERIGYVPVADSSQIVFTSKGA